MLCLLPPPFPFFHYYSHFHSVPILASQHTKALHTHTHSTFISLDSIYFIQVELAKILFTGKFIETSILSMQFCMFVSLPAVLVTKLVVDV